MQQNQIQENNVGNNEVLSLYIPRVNIQKWTANQILSLIANKFHCAAAYIDFVPYSEDPALKLQPKTKKPFQAPYMNASPFVSAFVHVVPSAHLNNLYANQDHNFHIKFKPDPQQKEFWMVFKNRDPVPRTHLNIHQVVDSAVLLNQQVQTMQLQIDQMLQTIHQLHNYIAQIVNHINIDTPATPEQQPLQIHEL